jgi:hypothetical protein
MESIADLINKYGFPIVAAGGMGYFIYYVWTWVTTEIKPVIGQANGTLIALIDRIRMLDNDLIRLNQKVETVMELRGKSIERERVKAEAEINKINNLEDESPIVTKRQGHTTAYEVKEVSKED